MVMSHASAAPHVALRQAEVQAPTAAASAAAPAAWECQRWDTAGEAPRVRFTSHTKKREMAASALL